MASWQLGNEWNCLIDIMKVCVEFINNLLRIGHEYTLYILTGFNQTVKDTKLNLT